MYEHVGFLHNFIHHTTKAIASRFTYSGAGQKEPAGQAVQFVAFVAPFVVEPLGHLTGLCIVLGHMCPSGQSVQVVCPNNENVPDKHAVMGDAGLGQEYPRGQRTHSALP